MKKLNNFVLNSNITTLPVVKKMSMEGGAQSRVNSYQIKGNKELIYKNRHIRTWQKYQVFGVFFAFKEKR